MAMRKSTQSVVPATEVRRKFGDIIRRAFSGKEHVIVEKDGLPVVAIISISEYEELVEEREKNSLQRESRLRQFDEAARTVAEQIAKTGLSDEELELQFEAARKRVHGSKHGSTDKA